MSTTFNILDLIFITFTIIFVTTAFFRGFVREVFALFNWLIALIISYLLAPYASKLLSSYSDNKLVIDVVSRVIIFVLAFITSIMSTSGLCKVLKEKMPKIFDRSLGVLFGIVKTLIIFGFIFSTSLNLYGFLLGKKIDDSSPLLPAWLRDAKSYNLLKFSESTLDPAVKKFFDSATQNFDEVAPKSEDLNSKIDELMNKNDKAEDGAKSLDNNPEDVLKNSGYNKKDIEKMNHLIEIIDK